MTKNSKTALAVALFLQIPLAAVGIVARAQPPGGKHHGPPPEAIAACKEKQPDASCQVGWGDKKIDGKCTSSPDGTLACRPDRPMGPPPELTQACENKQEGDSCSATFPDHTLVGHCLKGRADKLICRP